MLGEAGLLRASLAFSRDLAAFLFSPAQVHGGGWILLCGKRTPKQARQWQHEPVASEIRSLNVT